ncbi:MAG: hypothetical protein HY360_14805 [Verrucomicrobia bacterium]|nr:hypothetical protein [Verrucomicrobiota bacterium]
MSSDWFKPDIRRKLPISIWGSAAGVLNLVFCRIFFWPFACIFPIAASLHAQTLINVDFGAGTNSSKIGFAATGMRTNDFWNLYRHYDPKYAPGAPLVSHGLLQNLKLADGVHSRAFLAVSNAPGVWGNATGDPMYDSYIFPLNGSNITITVSKLDPGRYHFYLYGHADPDVTAEQNSVFTLTSGTNAFGPLATAGSAGWRAVSPWQERQQHIVFRDVEVQADKPVSIDVAPGANGVAVVNGLQIISRGTSPPRPAPAALKVPVSSTNLVFREIRYDGQVNDDEARFDVTVEVESMSEDEISAPLFEGDVALLAPDIPDGLRIVNTGKQFRLHAAGPGTYRLGLELVARITRAEPWNQISVTGPAAAIASVTARGAASDTELQLLSGMLLEGPPAPKQIGDSKTVSSTVRGFLGADRLLSLRWQGKTTEVTRKSLMTVETTAAAQITPTAVKFNTRLRYDILQAAAPRLTVALPAAHALTKLQGEQIRDWQVKPDGDRQIVTVEFIKPVEKSYNLTILSEQAVDLSQAGAVSQTATLVPPQPLEVERESGAFTLSAEEMQAEIDSTTGLRQVNATAGALAAYRFYGRPFALTAKLKRIEPVVNVADRVTARLEETRLLISHALTLTVEKAGIYGVDMPLPAGLTVTDVRGEGIEEWKVVPPGRDKLRVQFNSRLLGARKLEAELETPYKEFPKQFSLAPLRVAGASKETAQIGIASAPGIRVKTAEISGLREIPATTLVARSDESLAYMADQADWKLSVSTERLTTRLVAEVFNLITVGDGLVGGSATIRYGIINQGVREFQVKLPGHWKNVEFTGPNIRRKDQRGDLWTVALQDKAWGGYTLVVTYDYQFDPSRATLDAAGAHAIDLSADPQAGVERETGSVAVTTAASLKLDSKPVAEPLRVIDPTELAATDRALITRPVLLAYRYTGGAYKLELDVVRHEQVPVLDAVADRTQLTTVLTDSGEMLSQASFMVKNNDKQFQRFRLPGDAKLWGCYVNAEPVKAERDGDWTLVSLPRAANRDQLFAVDIKYAQQAESLQSWLPRRIQLEAPRTDVPNTYAEWQLFAPITHTVGRFGGSMTVAQGTTYSLRDAWRVFLGFYGDVWRECGMALIIGGSLALLITALVTRAVQRGWRGAVKVLMTFAVLAMLAAMLLPSFMRARMRSQASTVLNEARQMDAAKDALANADESNMGSFGGSLSRDAVQMREVAEEAGNERLRSSSAVRRGARIAAPQTAAPAAAASGMLGGTEASAKPAAPAEPLNDKTVTDAPSSGEVSQGALDGRGRVTHSIRVEGVGGAGGGVARSAFPAAAGIRSIQIDIPQVGQVFHFTKVLNVKDDPLSIRVSIIKTSVFVIVRAILQLAASLTGIWLIWRQQRHPFPSSFRIALGLALVVISVGSFLLANRVLHIALILAAGVIVLALLIWAVRKRWPRRGPPSSGGPASGTEPPKLSPNVPRSVSTVPKPAPSESKPASDASKPSSVSPTSGSAASAAAILIFAAFFADGLTLASHAQGTPVPTSPAVPTNAVSIVSADYTGAVREKAAEFDVAIQLFSAATNQTVMLFGEDVAVQQCVTRNGTAKLLREGKSVGVLLPQRGNAFLQLKLLTRLGGDVGKRRLSFGIPPALSSRFTMTLDEAEADVEFPTAVSFKRITENQQTRIQAVVGAADRVEMNWTPRMKRAAEITATVFCQNSTLATFGGGAVNTRTTLDYQITQGELRQARVRLPSGQRLLRVDGALIRIWEVKSENGSDVLTVDLLKGVSADYRLTVETEQALAKLPAQVKVETPHTLDVKRETGLLAVSGGEELSLTLEGSKDLQRIDVSDLPGDWKAGFSRATKEKGEGIVGAYRFLKSDFQLTAKAEAVQPQIEVVARNRLRVGAEEIRLSASFDYTIKRAGIFALKLAVPDGYRVETVTGNQILQWTERGGQARILEVSLKERTMGAYALRVELVQTTRLPVGGQVKELPKTLPIVGIHPLDAQKLKGFVSVLGEHGVSVKVASLDGLTEIPASAIESNDKISEGPASGGLAFKYIANETQASSAWKLTVTTENVESWVRAEIVNVITVNETLVSGRTAVRYEIANAPVKEFRLRVPSVFKNVELNGANIRRRDQNGDEWRVELQNKVRGVYSLTVTWEQPRESRTGVMDAAGVEALGVERETGMLAILAKAPLQVTEKSSGGELIKIDARELPEWAGAGSATGETVALAYRYLRPGYKLTLETKRLEDAAVLQALVDNAQWTTVVADDGQVMTEMTLAVRNNGRQHLEVELPADTRVWSAFVAGQPVRPSRRANVLLLPLERSGDNGAPVSVNLTYIGVAKFPRSKGTVSFASPKLDVPLKNARWDFYLPPDYEYKRFEGSMRHEQDGETNPLYRSFSLTEYLHQEEGKRMAQKAEETSEVMNAQQQLAVGNVKAATEVYRRAKSKGVYADRSDKDLMKLERDVNRAQSGNLIAAQQAYTSENLGKIGGQTTLTKEKEAAKMLKYDAEAAEQQWAKLQQAQELAVARVQPLRVNLPTRGARHSFTQVLQTEIKKPMTIQFVAVNTREIGWFNSSILAMGGFVALWVMAAIGLPKRPKTAQPTRD